MAKRDWIEQTCCAQVHSSFGVGFHTCGNKAKMQHDGKWYCGVHDPVKRAAQQKKRDAEWRAKYDATRAAEAEKAKRRAMGEKAIEALQLIMAGHNNPRALARQTLTGDTE